MLKETDCAIGVDLGGTKIEMGVVTSSGTVIDSIRVETDSKNGPRAIEEQLLRGIAELNARSSMLIKGVGIGVAGQIDDQTGVVQFAPNLPGWRDIPLRDNLQKITGLPIQLINDVRAITWGEWLFGAGKGYQDLICLFVGTGIGSGIVSGGKLLTGCSNTCGEVGHMSIDFRGPLCTCGSRGCLEAIAGGWGIAKQAQDAIVLYKEAGHYMLQQANGKIENVNAKIVVEAYRYGDSLALLILEKVKQALIAGCVNLIHAINPCCLILGGGIIDGIPEFIPLIEKGVRELALKASTQKLQIIPAKLGKEVGVIGAAAVVLAMLRKIDNGKELHEDSPF
ncbi:ROK family protein [Candidatus Protochlamydia naegleriophila]|uniref:ROK family protein n=1 Tax=Candidatus Protochlamydia naegleriophila TaxID=389348 RepID=A0A0U5ERD1_9BACT|nr:ROK family protein [Candidatus Protochlamydia naegleriophila]CUI16736.1 ROK family protein [Candidatus Protochlamydia naegleriophila]